MKRGKIESLEVRALLSINVADELNLGAEVNSAEGSASGASGNEWSLLTASNSFVQSSTDEAAASDLSLRATQFQGIQNVEIIYDDTGDEHVYTSVERAAIRALIEADFAPFAFAFFDEGAVPAGPHTDLIINADTNFSGAPLAGGQASEIDFRNLNLAAEVRVNINEFLGGPGDPPDTSENFIGLTATVAAHEIGHAVGLRHHDSFGPVGSGVSPSFFPFFPFEPAYPGPRNAVETGTNTMASPASVGQTIAQAAGDTYFSERSALKLQFIETGTVIQEVASAHGSAATAQEIALDRITVPNTRMPGDQNAGGPLAADAIAVLGSISVAGEEDWYSFTGRAGDVFTIEVISDVRDINNLSSVDVYDEINPTISVFNPDGSTFVNYYGTDAFNDSTFEPIDPLILDLVLPADGTYFFRVDAQGAQSGPGLDTGDYELFAYRFGSNEAPVAIDDFVVTPEDTPVNFFPTLNDTDTDGVVVPNTLVIQSGPANGTAVVNPVTGQVTYTPAPNFNGFDSFTYIAFDDANDASNVATVTITVTPVNDPPVAVNDLAVTDINLPVFIDLLGNDFDPDGPIGPSGVQIASQPLNGTALVDFGTQRVMYTPNPGFVGADVFTYRSVDSEGAISNSAQVTIRVGAPVGFTGTVYADRDGDGTFGADELGIPGVTITFTKNDGPVVFSVSTQTAADGTYALFESLPSGFILPAGVYTITQQQPEAFIDGADSIGSPPPAAVLNDVFHNITLGAGQIATGYLFGELGLNASFLSQHPELRRFFASTEPGSSTGLFGPIFVSPGDAVGTVNNAGFSLRTSNNTVPTGLPNFNFGLPQWHPISGDWNGDGIDTVGAYNSDTATFFLTDNNESGAASYPAFNYGIPGMIPLAGDWNGDGIDTVGVYDPATATFFLRNYNTSGVADVPAFNYGMKNWVPLAGDWEGLGIDTIGAYNPDTATYFLRYTNDSGIADISPFNYGMPNWQPVTGDWNDDGIETAGAFNSATATFFLRNSNTSGVGEVVFNHGTPGSSALVGHWMPMPGQALMLDGTPGPVKASDLRLTSEDVMPLLIEAVGKWTTAGLDVASASLLADINIHITDLPGNQLGLATDGQIYLDLNAAGQGWFVDLTPADDAEFTTATAQGWLAADQTSAALGVDLLTVLTHELGHILGLGDQDVDTLDIMYESLTAGNRRSPDAAAVDRLFSD